VLVVLVRVGVVRRLAGVSAGRDVVARREARVIHVWVSLRSRAADVSQLSTSCLDDMDDKPPRFRDLSPTSLLEYLLVK
jgi:hypothetical protein